MAAAEKARKGASPRGARPAAKKASAARTPAAAQPRTPAGDQAPPTRPEAWATPPTIPNAPTANWQAAPMPMRPDEERTYGMFLHLSAFAGVFVGGLLIAGPLLMWLIKKDVSPFIDRHGRAAVNFHLSLIVYVVAGVFAYVVIAIVTLGIGALLLIPVLIGGAIAVAVVAILFPILACLRANAGHEYTYPLSIRFIPPPSPGAGTPTLI